VTAWLEPYYQYANRIAVLSFLHSQKIAVRLLNIYFVGDISRKGWISPQTSDEWRPHLEQMESRLGLSSSVPFVNRLFLSTTEPETYY
jgi:hypothetical protein